MALLRVTALGAAGYRAAFTAFSAALSKALLPELRFKDAPNSFPALDTVKLTTAVPEARVPRGYRFFRSIARLT